MAQNKKIKVGIIGVGNCFSGLIQGIEYYNKNPKNKIIGLMNELVGPYSLHDISFVSAFDVDVNKVGKALDKACMSLPNLVKWTKLPKIPVIVHKAPALDGVGIYVKEGIKIVKQDDLAVMKKHIINELRKTQTEVLINYLPVGSQQATEFWASIALETKCAFINCIPVFIASDKKWAMRFKKAGVPIIGDDIKGQVGATIVHRILAKLCDDRGAQIDQSYQLNVGGNTDFLNMKEAERLVSKKISKTRSVVSQMASQMNVKDIYIGPSDYVPFLGNTKLAFIKIAGRMFADIPFSIELKLEVDDKSNSAGVVIDAIRLAKLALDRKKGGYLDVSSYLMKHPLKQKSDSEAHLIVEKFIKLKR